MPMPEATPEINSSPKPKHLDLRDPAQVSTFEDHHGGVDPRAGSDVPPELQPQIRTVIGPQGKEVEVTAHQIPSRPTAQTPEEYWSRQALSQQKEYWKTQPAISKMPAISGMVLR